MDNSALATRMKNYYEAIPKTRLMRRTPVALRLDGKAFHSFTRGFKRPFDEVLIKSMQRTMKYLCENIQNSVLGYQQSDEITLILLDYQTFDTDAWFDYEVQKMCSIAASMATMAFNKIFAEEVDRFCGNPHNSGVQANRYIAATLQGAMFDCRCFNIPKEEVTNLIYWRQLDASRNSVQMVGQAYFSHKELQEKTCSDIQDMLMEKYSINWNDFLTHQKRGSCCIKERTEEEVVSTPEWGDPVVHTLVRSRWIIDTEVPIFNGEGRDYIERLIRVGEA